MTVVKVRAVREGRLWVLHLENGGATQVRALSDVEGMVADYVSLLEGVPAESVRVDLVAVDPGEGAAVVVEAAKSAQHTAARAVENAAVLMREAVAELKGRGLSGVEAARVLGVSPQRISQLAASAAGGASAARRVANDSSKGVTRSAADRPGA